MIFMAEPFSVIGKLEQDPGHQQVPDHPEQASRRQEQVNWRNGRQRKNKAVGQVTAAGK
jgi:hypothetical protein